MIELYSDDKSYIGQELRAAATSSRDAAETERDYKLVSMLRPKIALDGNQWCVLYGDNLMEGVAGFGDTPYAAVLNFNTEWHRKIGA